MIAAIFQCHCGHRYGSVTGHPKICEKCQSQFYPVAPLATLAIVNQPEKSAAKRY